MAARCVHMAGRTDTHHRVVPTCHAVGWVAPLAHVADNQGSGWSQSATVICGLNQSCVCDLMKGHFPESQDFFDTDWRHKITGLNCSLGLWPLDVYTWQAGQMLIMELCPPVVPWDR